MHGKGGKSFRNTEFFTFEADKIKRIDVYFGATYRTAPSSGNSDNPEVQEYVAMSLTLHLHPLASFCQKALIALYENDTPFTPNIVDLGNETARGVLKLWPIGKFPVLRDEARDQTDSGIEHHHRVPRPALSGPDPSSFPPMPTAHRKRACATASTISMCTSRCRRSSATGCVRREKSDPHGVEEARRGCALSYDMIEQEMASRTWAMGDAFSMADCAAAPALFYANEVMPFVRKPQERGGLFRPPEGAAVLCARAQGGRTLFRDVPGDRAVPSAITSE